MKTILMNVLLLCAVTSQAQIAYWAVQPKYDQVKTDESADLIISKSADSTYLWTGDGRRLAKTTLQVYPYREGKAVVVMPRTDLLKGFYTQEGKFVAIEYGNVAYSSPYFSDGHLLVVQNGVYRFVNSKGSLLYNRCEKAFPFKNGFAACRQYEDAEKKKGAYYTYIATDGKEVTLAAEGKAFSHGDIDYLSSVNDEGTGVVVAKNKLYFFDAKKKTLQPVYTDGSNSRQAVVEGDADDFIKEVNSYTYALHAKGDEVVVYLNLTHQPTAIVRGGQRTEFKKNNEQNGTAEDGGFALTTTGENPVGLMFNGQELLPPQFESVRPLSDDKALVMKDGKWGVIKVDADRHFHIFVNDHQKVGFRHRVYDTKIRIDLPASISSLHTTLISDRQSGCLIDKRSWDGNDTEYGNYVEYECRLNIPQTLPDTTVTITYPVQVQYDGILSKVIDMPVQAWHAKYYTVDIVEADSKINNGAYTFVVNIQKDDKPGEIDYPFSVSVDAKGLNPALKKISDTRWQCKLLSLKQGLNKVNVQIMEEGCPPKIYPFEVNYQKPTQKSTNTQVIIYKQSDPHPAPPNNSGSSNIKL